MKFSCLRLLKYLTTAEANLIQADLINASQEPVSAPLHNSLACCQVAIARAQDILATREKKRRGPCTRVSPLIIKAAHDLRAQGRTLDQVAAQMHVTRSTAARYCTTPL